MSKTKKKIIKLIKRILIAGDMPITAGEITIFDGKFSAKEIKEKLAKNNK